MFLQLSHVSHRFGEGPWLFRDLSARLEPGELVSVVGPSGSGKSTLLGIVAGQVKPSEGEVKYPPKSEVVWVFQNPVGVAHRSAQDHVALPFLARGAKLSAAQEAARSLLDDFKLSRVAQQPFGALSGGEAQRLMLARALAAQPSILLVDEPTAQLDPTTAREVAQAMRALAGRQSIVVVATHDPEVAASGTAKIDLHQGTLERATGTEPGPVASAPLPTATAPVLQQAPARAGRHT